MKTEKILLVLVPIILLYDFAKRLFFPATEWLSPGVRLLTLVFEAAMVIGIVGLTFRRLKSTTRPIKAAGPWLALPGLGLLAGLGLFVMRLGGGDEAALPPHAPHSASRGKSVPDDLRKWGERMETLVASYHYAMAKYKASVWFQVEGADLQKLPRKDLRDFLARYDELIASYDRMIEFLEEPGLQDKADALVRFAKAQGVSPPQLELKPDGWRKRRFIDATNRKIWRIVDAHWEEWRTNSWPPEGDPKPWEKEALALTSEIENAEKKP